MNHLLASRHVARLAQFASSRVVLAFDFDGTLAPIVAERSEARMRERTRSLLERLCRLYPCAVISGRSRSDVERRVEGALLRHIIGNHGLEPSQHLETFERHIATVRPRLEEALRTTAGVDIENKRFSLAVHYRRAQQKRTARHAIHAAAAQLTLPIRLIPGKLVVNVLPHGAPHKGDALLRVLGEENADAAIYVGDDENDEDVFALNQPGRLLSLRVGRSASSAATYFLRDQREVDSLLARLLDLRAEGPENMARG
jgi:trehalose 6-phosphate phosphatase